MLTVVGMDVWSVKSFLPVRYANIMEEKFFIHKNFLIVSDKNLFSIGAVKRFC